MSSNEELLRLMQGCESEQLHLSGAIQPFGALLALRQEDRVITHASANMMQILGISPQTLLGHPLESVAEFFLEPLNRLVDDPQRSFIYSSVRRERERFALKISRADRWYVIDIEKFEEHEASQLNQNGQIELYFAPDDASHLQEYYDIYVKSIRKLIGFDRVMLYQFQSDWSGMVVAEAASEKMGSYLGLRFPASDIPKIARDLYMLNPSRTICDTDGASVPLLGLDATPPDLTYSDTRSVSPLHIEYLKNMGVRASYSTPIIIGSNLWGLLACHHLAPRHLSAQVRHRSVELSKTFELGLKSYFAKSRMQHLERIDFQIEDIFHRLFNATIQAEGLEEEAAAIAKLIDADGFVLLSDVMALQWGSIPDAAQMERIDAWFTLTCNELTLQSHALSYEPFLLSAPYLGPSGVLAIKSAHPKRLKRCYWFREEMIEELHWAGNPNKPMVENADAMMLSPRRSFEKWVETKRGHSRRFSLSDMTTATKFTRQLFRWI